MLSSAFVKVVPSEPAAQIWPELNRDVRLQVIHLLVQLAARLVIDQLYSSQSKEVAYDGTTLQPGQS